MAESSSVSILRAVGKKLAPCSVSATLRVLRSNKGRSISSSNSRMVFVRVDCVRLSTRDAPVKLPASAMATKARRWRKLTFMTGVRSGRFG